MQNQNDPQAFLIASEHALASISATRRLEDKLNAIERLLSSGISRRAVVELLNENGFSFTIYSFASALKRVRKRKINLPINVTKKEGTFVEMVATEQIHRQPIPKKEPRKFIYDIHAPTDWKRADPKGNT